MTDRRAILRLARWVPMATALGALLAACGATSRPSGRVGTGTGVSLTAPTGRRAAAQHEAAHLLGLLRLPSDGKQEQCTVKPQSLDTDPAHALEQRCFTVPEGEDAVYAYVRQHMPAGARVEETGRGGNFKTGTHTWYVTFSFPKVGQILASGLLNVDVSAGSNGSAQVETEAQSDWIVPRPGAETIPAGVREVIVLTGTRKLTVTNPAKVAGAVRLFDSLSISQPGAISCPAVIQGFAPKRLIVRFTAGGSRPVLAQAKLTGASAGTECYPITFSVRGKPMQALAGSMVRARLARVLGGKLP